MLTVRVGLARHVNATEHHAPRSTQTACCAARARLASRPLDSSRTRARTAGGAVAQAQRRALASAAPKPRPCYHFLAYHMASLDSQSAERPVAAAARPLRRRQPRCGRHRAYSCIHRAATFPDQPCPGPTRRWGRSAAQRPAFPQERHWGDGEAHLERPEIHVVGHIRRLPQL